MVRSMSGHGRGEAGNERVRVVVEVRSVNHRFCRVSTRLPSDLMSLEDEIRRLVQERVQRGKVDVDARVESVSGAQLRFDQRLARVYGDQLREVAEQAGTERPRLGDVLALPGVMVSDAIGGFDPDADVEALRAALTAALDAHDAMRRREGEHLAADLRARLDTLHSGSAAIEAAAAEAPARARDALRARLEVLLAEVGRTVDDDRLVQEAAYHAERADITEELVRLRSHLRKSEELLESSDAPGRSLDFLAQELHRELSTIGAKTKELPVAELTVELKAELERIREQVQNLE